MKKRFSGTQYDEIKTMMEEIDSVVFEYSLAKHFDKNPDGFLKENYGPNGKIATPQSWATCYNYSYPRTSMIAGMELSVRPTTFEHFISDIWSSLTWSLFRPWDALSHLKLPKWC